MKSERIGEYLLADGLKQDTISNLDLANFADVSSIKSIQFRL
jgi:hypothetical protein